MSRAWMPLYIGDFLADTMHLNCQETGAYMRLLMHAWQHDGLVPDNDEILSRIVRCHPPHWRRLRKIMEPFFDLTKTPGSWYSKRVGLELIKTREISNKNKARALVRHKNGTANAMPNMCQSQSQSHVEAKKPLHTPRTPRAPRARASPLPSNWKPSDEDRTYARAKEWPEARIDSEAERFRDHAIANGRRQINWPAAWRNWVSSPYQKPSTNGTAPPPRPGSREDVRERNANAYRKLCEFVDAGSDDARRGRDAGEAPFGLLPGIERSRS